MKPIPLNQKVIGSYRESKAIFGLLPELMRHLLEVSNSSQRKHNSFDVIPLIFHNRRNNKCVQIIINYNLSGYHRLFYRGRHLCIL